MLDTDCGFPVNPLLLPPNPDADADATAWSLLELVLGIAGGDALLVLATGEALLVLANDDPPLLPMALA